MESETLEQTKIIINNIFKQASKGSCEIQSALGTWQFYTKFYSNVNGVLLKNGEDIFSTVKAPSNILASDFSVPAIQIPNTQAFAELVDKYISIAEKFYQNDREYFFFTQDSFKEKLTLDLFVSATNYDFNNILQYIDTRTKMLNNELNLGNFTIGKMGELTVTGSISKNICSLEGPYKFTINLSNGDSDKFTLPKITFGIVNSKLFIYAIQADKEKQSSTLSKKLDRYFRKVNKGVDSESLIAKTSPNALVALTIFLSAMRKEGIEQIVAPSFMPLRYNANLSAKHTRLERDKAKGLESAQTPETILKEHNRNQANITNKFTYTFLRYCHHFGECKFEYDEIKEESTIKLIGKATTQDNIIHDIDSICTHPLNLRTTSKEK